MGISNHNGSYSLLTSEGNFKVEIGDLDNIDFKVKGFKTFVEKYLVYQNPEKYSKISVKYDNQIVTTLNPHYTGNDSILTSGQKQIEKTPVVARQKALANAQKLMKTPEKKTEKKEEKKKEPAKKEKK